MRRRPVQPLPFLIAPSHCSSPKHLVAAVLKLVPGNPSQTGSFFDGVGATADCIHQSQSDALDSRVDLAPSHFAKIEYHPSHDHTLLGFTSERAMQDALHALKHLGYLDERATSIGIDGWKRIEELRREQPNSRKAFVAYWFDDEMDEAWEEGFKPGILDTEFFEPVRMLDIEHAGKIDNRIIAGYTNPILQKTLEMRLPSRLVST